jgi:hypothetical protein
VNGFLPSKKSSFCVFVVLKFFIALTGCLTGAKIILHDEATLLTPLSEPKKIGIKSFLLNISFSG